MNSQLTSGQRVADHHFIMFLVGRNINRALNKKTEFNYAYLREKKA